MTAYTAQMRGLFPEILDAVAEWEADHHVEESA
jgi:hypothetical protein